MNNFYYGQEIKFNGQKGIFVGYLSGRWFCQIKLNGSDEITVVEVDQVEGLQNDKTP